jgi:uncharacterized protein (DUF4415 family)
MSRASLDDLKQMEERGELFHDPNAPEGPTLGADFWANAMVLEPSHKRSVHLRLGSDVFDFFVAESNGKGHIAKMQAVLKAYADAHR